MAALRDLTPSGLRRLSMDERKRLLEALLSVNYTWLSEREREHLFWGHGLRCRRDRADFERATAYSGPSRSPIPVPSRSFFGADRNRAVRPV